MSPEGWTEGEDDSLPEDVEDYNSADEDDDE